MENTINDLATTNRHAVLNINKTQLLPDDEPSDEQWSEDEAEIPAGVTDTMLTAPDFLSDS